MKVMSFRAYMTNIEKKSGKSAEDFWKMASEKGFVKEGKIVASHVQMLQWLKSEVGLSHVYANFIIQYFRLRTKDPKLTEKTKEWAYKTGYQDKK